MKGIVLLNLYLAVLENGGPRASPHRGPKATSYQCDRNQIVQSSATIQMSLTRRLI